MTVSELIEQLKTLPPDLLVVMSEDEEGNRHRKINGASDDDAFWNSDTREVEDNEYQGAAPCVVIW